MRAGWQELRLGDVCEFRPSKDEVRARIDGTDRVSFAPMEDLGIGRKFLEPQSTRSLSEVAGSYTYFADGDVLLAKITPCFENGKLGIARNLTNGAGFGSSEYIVFRPDERLLNEYLYYFLSRDDFRTEGAERMSGAVGHKRVSKDFIEQYRIPLPPLPEQHRVVAILDQAFESIATAKANTERSLRMAREVFESHLSSAFAELETTSETAPAMDLCTRITVGHVGSMAGEYKATGIPFLRSQNIRPFFVSLDNVVYIDNGFHTSLGKSQLRAGDLAIVRTGYPGTAAVIPEWLGEANCSDLVIVRPKPNVDPHFLALFFNSSFGKSLVAGQLVGAAQKHFNVTAAKDVPIPNLPLPEQRQIVARFDALRERTSELEEIGQRKLAALEQLRASLLHQAFHGDL